MSRSRPAGDRAGRPTGDTVQRLVWWVGRRPTRSVFTALAVCMVGLGLAVGIAFPAMVIAMGVPRGYALRPGFFAATLGAGLLVGYVNYRMVRWVVAGRLGVVTRRMSAVERALAELVGRGDWAASDPGSYHLPVDSTDELGAVAGAFNRLVDAAALAHRVEQAAADLVGTVAAAAGIGQLCERALDRILYHGRGAVSGGAIAVLDNGQVRAAVERGLPDGLTVAGLTDTALAAPGDHHEFVHAGHTVLVLPVRSGPGCVGLVVVSSPGRIGSAPRRLLTILVDSLRGSLDAIRLREQLAYSAAHDALTGLANRERFLDLVERALARNTRPAVLVVDLDDFKAVNDGLGYAAGDRLLTELGRRIGGLTRGADTVARYGGDEFAVLIEEGADQVAVAEVAIRLFDRLSAPIEFGDRRVTLNVCIGVAAADDDATGLSLLRDADSAVTAAKRRGKGRIQVFDSPLRAEVEQRRAMQQHLPDAIERGEFSVAYQPIVDLQTGALVGVEALARWVCGEHGPITPARFIPLAEETGIIHPLGHWMLRQACRQARDWQRQYPGRSPYVSVNVSPLQVHDGPLLDIVAGALVDSGLPTDLLVLEVTEGVFLRDTRRVLGRLRQLRRDGVRLALDDFGTGYSALSYLQRFPFDLVKLDKSFIDRLDDPDGSTLVRGTLALTRALGMTTVAEGVERPEQAEVLADLRCPLVQGYLYSPPVPAAQIGELLARPVPMPTPQYR